MPPESPTSSASTSAASCKPIYWGQRLGDNDALARSPHLSRSVASFDLSQTTTPQEFAGWGSGLYVEPSLKITFPDGNRDLVLHYVSHTIDGNTLEVVLKDISREVFVTLKYVIDPDTGILGRSATIENRTKDPLTIKQAAAAAWTLPRGTDYTLSYLTGRWGSRVPVAARDPSAPASACLRAAAAPPAIRTIPGSPSAVANRRRQTGDVWFGALAWSGSWRITVEQTQLQQIRVTGGYNPFDFGYRLAPGEKLATPVFYARLHARTAWAKPPASCIALSWPRSLPQAAAPQAPPRPLQLLGSDRDERR